MAPETLKRIGTVLLEKGYISEEQLNTALKLQTGSSKKVGDILVETGVITEEQLVEVVSERLKIPKLNLSAMVINPTVINIIPVEMAKRFNVIPVIKMANILTLAMADPLDVIAIDEIKYHTKCIIKRTVAARTALAQAIDQYYSVADSVRDILGEAQEGEHSDTIVTSADFLDAFNEGDNTVVKLVNMILTRAIKDGASDVHFEPDENELRIRYRVNGVMREEAAPPKKLQPEVISRIKIASELDVSEKRIPQDGRMSIRVEGSEIDLRVSTLPTIHGEKVVIRILDKRNLSTGLPELGMNDSVLEGWRSRIRTPEGLILISGPTSSGKTSTLYASLMEINSIEKNIITVEDPVEFSLPLINQVQINEKATLTFASALRAILRQNPDIIMVGEIRDSETAAIGVRAALTGHLVFSTIHTNDSIGTITRLMDMGIEQYMVASALEAILAQRLIRTICEDCKEETEISPTLFAKAFPNGGPMELKFYSGRGCRQCRNTGYAGLTGLYELVQITDNLREMILAKASETAIKAEAYRNGYRPLFEAGIELMKQGVTTLDEILRVTSSIDVGDTNNQAAAKELV
ncbi:MAG: Flp pilus assembly complex ATPase component TadA [candidate division Zixibacteria bacterium]|nr:Flp pilus assembly complex ATPase component TadA [candidate division Zixibacteria bacterium]